MTNLNEFQKKVYDATKQAFNRLRNECDGESFYAYALYTDSSVMTVLPAANSLEKLKIKIEETNEESENPYLTWETSEWWYESFGDEFFKEIYKIMNEGEVRDDIKHRFKLICHDLILVLKSWIVRGILALVQREIK